MSQTEQIKLLRRQLTETQEELAYKSESLDRQLELAAGIHRTLLPKPIRHDRIHVDLRYIPIESVGGDYCQVRFPDSNTCYITMCDVTGHGIAPALLAARVSSEVRHFIHQDLPPHQIVQSLNDFICEHFSETYLYLSFIASRIDLLHDRITWCGAGHPSPLLIRKQNQHVIPLVSQNPWIGIDQDILCPEPEHTLFLEAGDRLVYYTDGITETMNELGEELGVPGLIQFALHAQNENLFILADNILKKVTDFRHGPITDDKTLIVAEIK